MTQLLIDEPPLQVLPSLATKIGLNEAIVLQQFHYWLQRSNNIKDGYKWIYNSYKGWNEQFPFFGKNTLIRTIKSLEKQGLLITANYNKAGFDKTTWYRIDYDKLSLLKKSQACTQNGQTHYPKWVNGVTQNGQTNTNRLPENTSIEKRYCRADARPDHTADIKTIIDYLNEKTNKHFKATTNKTKAVIKARLNEGFTVDDFKKVIDNKTTEWLNDSKMNKFLRPETLFSNKFEGYLNETPKQSSNYHSEYDNYF